MKIKNLHLIFLLASLLISCGKKPTYTSDIDGDDSTTQELNTFEKILNVSDSQPYYREIASENSKIVIPPSISIKEGNHSNRYIYLFLNSSEYTDFYCAYYGQGNSFIFEDCYEDINHDGIPDKLGMVPGDIVAQAKGKYIELELTFPKQSGPLKAEMLIQIESH